MGVHGLPHPGPPPEAFEFPFAEASAALAAIDEAVAGLGTMMSVHEDAVAVVRVDFTGETRTSFDRGFSQLMGETDAGIGRLQVQRDQLEDDIADARRRRVASLDAVGDWSRAMERYQEDNDRAPAS